MTRFVVVVLLLAVIAIVLRLRARGSGPGRTLKITARAAIGRGTSLVVVEIEGRRLLVGAAANQMTVLADLGEEEPESATDDAQPALRFSSPARVVASPTAFARSLGGTSGTTNRPLVERIRSMTVRTVDPALRSRARHAS